MTYRTRTRYATNLSHLFHPLELDFLAAGKHEVSMQLHYLTVPGSVFLGAFAGYLGVHQPAMDWATARPVLAGAVLAGVIAVCHLYMPQPSDKTAS
jgi:hypothetical protein